MKPYRRLLGFSLVPNAEIINGLRANVSKLQLKVNTQQKYIEKLLLKIGRLKEQQEINRVYTENLKEAARVAIKVEDKDAPWLQALEKALGGVE